MRKHVGSCGTWDSAGPLSTAVARSGPAVVRVSGSFPLASVHVRACSPQGPMSPVRRKASSAPACWPLSCQVCQNCHTGLQTSRHNHRVQSPCIAENRSVGKACPVGPCQEAFDVNSSDVRGSASGLPGRVSHGSHGDTLQRGGVPDVSLSALFSIDIENTTNSFAKWAKSTEEPASGHGSVAASWGLREAHGAPLGAH